MTDGGYQLDLFDWTPPPATTEVIDFLARRETLPRHILAPVSEVERKFSALDKLIGLLPPTPIFPFKRKA